MKKIAIINVYGHQNIGDGAILDESLRIITEAYKKEISFDIHTANLNSVHLIDYDKKLLKPFLNPYGIAIKANRKINDAQKIIRFIKIYIISYGLVYLSKIFPNILPKTGDYSYIYSLKNSDKVFSVGGGYLRTKSKYKDLFGFLLTILSIRIAHFYHKKIIFLPMSFGNFASKFHEHIAYASVRNDALFIREIISYEILKKRKVNELFLAPDMALLSNYKKIHKRTDQIVITAREWLSKKEQNKYESELSKVIDYVWEKYKLKSVFIPMVWNSSEEHDAEVARRIHKKIKNKHIFSILNINNPKQVKEILSKSKMALCTRMHSAILSYGTFTPFISIAYEHKTNGILRMLNLKKFNLNINEFNFNDFKFIFDTHIKNEFKDFYENIKLSNFDNEFERKILVENLKKI